MSGGDEPNSLPKEMSIEELNPIVRKLCVGTKGYPETGGDGALVKDVTNSLAWNVSQAGPPSSRSRALRHEPLVNPPQNSKNSKVCGGLVLCEHGAPLQPWRLASFPTRFCKKSA